MSVGFVVVFFLYLTSYAIQALKFYVWAKQGIITSYMTSLIVFVKNPIPGAVKTRLQTRYAPDQVADLYTAFVRDVLARAERIDVDRRVIAFDPPDAESEVRALFGRKALWEYVPQVQDDLGVRMREALVQELDAGASATVLIGTDIPSLPVHHITQAFDLLRTVDVVLGPSTDGGYYLVGVSKSIRRRFLRMWNGARPAFWRRPLTAFSAQGIRSVLFPPGLMWIRPRNSIFFSPMRVLQNSLRA